MISMEEILKGAKLEEQSPEIQASLKILLERVNKVRLAWNRPMTVTSGLRTMLDHLRIYKEKAVKEGKVFDPKSVPMLSRHLFGEAVDVFDPKRELQAWCLKNEPLLAQIGLWMEDFSATPNWVHFQVRSPKSGKRWFKP